MVKFSESGKKLKESKLESFEKKIGLELPLEYKSFLLKHNGGECDPCVFDFIENGEESDSSISTFYAIGGIDDDYDLEENIDIYINDEKRLPDGLIPIAEDDGGNLVCISCTGDDKGKIYFWNHEEEDEDDLTANLYFVSNSFNEFVESLRDLE